MLFFNGTDSIGGLAQKLERHVRGKLWLQVVIGLVLGLGIGIVLGPDLGLVEKATAVRIAQWLALPGEIFLRLIKMVLIPLVFFSIIRGLGGSNIKDLKRIGPKFILYLLTTTTIACAIGITMATLLKPGSFMQTGDDFVPRRVDPVLSQERLFSNLPQTIVELIPDNPFSAAMEGEMVSVVIFSLLFGIAFAMQPNKNIKHMLGLFDDLLRIFMTIVQWAMHLAPLAVFGLTARMAAETGMSVLLGMGTFVGTVLISLAMLLLMYYGIIAILCRRNPLEFESKIAGVQLLAFSTSSSAAVMPVSIRTAEEELGVDAETSEVIVPLGATINMDGTAVYQSIAIIFMAQAAGMTLTIPQMIMMTVAVVASSVGSPGTPGVGVAILTSVAASMGIPTGAHGLILGVDRILDMSRTAVNVTGDLTACVLFGGKKK